jgi:hypothetical protein
MAANGSADLINTQLNPEQAAQGLLVFDVPESATPTRWSCTTRCSAVEPG